jgi:hypothetical protein
MMDMCEYRIVRHCSPRNSTLGYSPECNTSVPHELACCILRSSLRSRIVRYNVDMVFSASHNDAMFALRIFWFEQVYALIQPIEAPLRLVLR